VKLAPKWAISSGMAQMRPRGLVVMVGFLAAGEEDLGRAMAAGYQSYRLL
jgi:hypothetical protein